MNALHNLRVCPKLHTDSTHIFHTTQWSSVITLKISNGAVTDRVKIEGCPSLVTRNLKQPLSPPPTSRHDADDST